MKYLYIIIFSLLTITNVVAQNPNWTINSADYEYSMSFSSIAKIGDDEVRNTDDYVSAWINGELRGVTQAFYVSATDRYYFLLNVYSNSVNEDSITFKIYDASADTQIDFENGEVFKVLENNGTYSNPYELITPPGIQLSYFEIDGIEQSVSINSDTRVVTIYARDSVDLSSLVASFNFNFSTSAKVNGVTQTSGVTANNFSDTVHYIVGSSSQPGVVEDWAVVVNQGSFLNEYELQGLVQDVKINNQDRSVVITLQDSTDLNNLGADFEFSFIDSLFLNSIKQSNTSSIASMQYSIMVWRKIGLFRCVNLLTPTYLNFLE